MRNKILNLVKEIDSLYDELISSNKDISEALDKLLLEILVYEDMQGIDLEDSLVIDKAIKAISYKVELIYSVLNTKRDKVTLEDLREEFIELEKLRFETINKYVMGIVKILDIEQFKDKLFEFRKRLYAISISDNNILEIAKMKSKVQHFNTEVLEDEEVLRVAYSNSN